MCTLRFFLVSSVIISIVSGGSLQHRRRKRSADVVPVKHVHNGVDQLLHPDEFLSDFLSTYSKTEKNKLTDKVKESPSTIVSEPRPISLGIQQDIQPRSDIVASFGTIAASTILGIGQVISAIIGFLFRKKLYLLTIVGAAILATFGFGGSDDEVHGIHNIVLEADQRIQRANEELSALSSTKMGVNDVVDSLIDRSGVSTMMENVNGIQSFLDQGVNTTKNIMKLVSGYDYGEDENIKIRDARKVEDIGIEESEMSQDVKEDKVPMGQKVQVEELSSNQSDPSISLVSTPIPLTSTSTLRVDSMPMFALLGKQVNKPLVAKEDKIKNMLVKSTSDSVNRHPSVRSDEGPKNISDLGTNDNVESNESSEGRKLDDNSFIQEGTSATADEDEVSENNLLGLEIVSVSSREAGEQWNENKENHQLFLEKERANKENHQLFLEKERANQESLEQRPIELIDTNIGPVLGNFVEDNEVEVLSSNKIEGQHQNFSDFGWFTENNNDNEIAMGIDDIPSVNPRFRAAARKYPAISKVVDNSHQIDQGKLPLSKHEITRFESKKVASDSDAAIGDYHASEEALETVKTNINLVNNEE